MTRSLEVEIQMRCKFGGKVYVRSKMIEHSHVELGLLLEPIKEEEGLSAGHRSSNRRHSDAQINVSELKGEKIGILRVKELLLIEGAPLEIVEKM